MSLPDIGHKCELVKGKLMMSPAGGYHGDLCGYLTGRLSLYVRQNHLGWVFDSSTGFWMKSGNLRSPDVSFVARRRFPDWKRPPKQFLSGSPDLAVEVLSPSDTVERLHDRIVEYFENNTLLAWVINPDEQSALVYRQGRPEAVVTPGGQLEGEQVVPGFVLPLAELFEE